MKARNRPPRLDDVSRPAPAAAAASAPTVPDLLLRAKVAGKTADPSRSAVREAVERLDVSPLEAWTAIRSVFGATPDDVHIDVDCTVRAARVAASRIAAVARGGGRISFATAQPASLLGVHVALAHAARAAGAVIDDADDAGPLRVDGRSSRWLRWLDGVAVVTHGASLLGVRGRVAPDEWMLLAGRPALVVADGVFAAAAAEARVEAVAFAGLDQVELAVPTVVSPRCLVVPVHRGRPARAYAPLVALLEETVSGRRGARARDSGARETGRSR